MNMNDSDKFPKDYIFKLAVEDVKLLRSKFPTTNLYHITEQ